MTLNEIKLNDKVSIFSIEIENYNKEQLVKELNFNVIFNKTSTIYNQSAEEVAPGIQSEIVIQSENLVWLQNKCIEAVKLVANIPKDRPYFSNSWVFISKNTNKDSAYHSHESNKPTEHITTEKNNWTYTFYVQMPDNLKDVDGYLFFKTDDNVVHKLLPKEGELFVFPANLKHRPETNLNSNTDRIVYAGNYLDLNIEKEYIKNKKTLL
jgi:hypothetical protein